MGALEALRDMETGQRQEASRAAPILGAMAERGRSGGHGGSGDSGGHGGSGESEAMLSRGAREAMAEQGAREAMA